MSRQVPLAIARQSSKLSPKFVSPYGNGGITMIIDGTTVMNDVVLFSSFDSNGNPPAGPWPSGSTQLPTFGSFTYTSMVTIDANLNAWVQVNGTLSTHPGSHTLAVVQTNGPCIPDQYNRELCIPNTNGYVLAEAQTTVNISLGTGNIVLYPRGVMQSAYLCDAACDGQAGTPDAQNVFHLTAYVSDEAGAAIYQQTDAGGNIVPFDNGSYQIVETDNNGIVQLGGNTGPFSAPGNQDLYGIYGEKFTIQCLKIGSTVVAAELLPSDPSTGSVTGFTYTSQNYPQPQVNPILGSVGADEYFGNKLSVNCSASLVPKT